MHKNVHFFFTLFCGVNIYTEYRILSMFMRAIKHFEDLRV